MEEYGARNSLLLELGYRDYRTYLRSKLWKDIRLKQLGKKPECYGCGKLGVQVHHGAYDIATLTGESDKDLFSICAGCHLKIEFTVNGHKRSPAGATRQLKYMRRVRLAMAISRNQVTVYRQ